MYIANIHHAKTNLSKLIEQVVEGNEVIIAKAGRPVAKLVAYTPKKNARKPGFWKHKLWIADDFDAEDKEINELFYGKE